MHEDLDEIVPRLYLGSWEAATDTNILNKYHITHILTVETSPLPRSITCFRHITTKFIEALDLPSEDLLSHFDDIYAFIEKGLNTGAVLVHCYYGVSRSATAVLAYLMKKYGWSFSKAFQKVKSKRRFVYPNEGFAAQLKLYQDFGCKIDRNEKKCKLFRLKLVTEKIKEGRNIPRNFLDLVQPDPKKFTDSFKCKNCHRALVAKINQFPHEDKSRECSKIYFVEPTSWMKVTELTKGELYCPQCSKRVGAFNWLGWRCSCDFKMTPAFYLDPSEAY
ncbi:dual specificity protein phosphatase MPK-4-like [Sitophilus oryzae]|uniref:Dual specificity protein phosphatase MPK-4-like n=1 Tax=Sitophilus oryzae TaxID=7048 RepID=A0A6J2XXN5_SITOR|nr:dual specificity protein phosphatase MPK-4-like [Sitophilus oryzae]